MRRARELCIGVVAMVVGAALLAAPPAVGITATGVVVAGTGVPGTGNDQFSYMRHLAVDASMNVYVADFTRVMKWAPGALTGVTVAGGNGAGTNLNQVDAWGLAVDSAGRVFVGDATYHRVVRWDPGAASGVIVAGGNGQGSGLNQLDTPVGVAVDSDGNVYVADAANHRVVRWAPAATAGVVVAGGNGFGSNLNQLWNPNSVVVDSNKRVFVSDTSNNRVVRWNQGATTGVVVAGGNGWGSSLNQLHNPGQIALDPGGSLWIADVTNERVVKWETGATSGLALVSGASDTESGVALDPLGRVYIPGDFIVKRYAQPTLAPVNTSPPTLTGTAKVGSTLTCNRGTWTNSPTSYQYEFLRGGTAVQTSETDTTLTLAPADLGASYRCRVTAFNNSGSFGATSAARTITAPPAPVNTVLPALTGTARVGSVLTCSQGTWTNYPTSYTYKFFRGSTMVQTSTTLRTRTTVAADVGAAVTCQVTATNISGSAVKSSASRTIAAGPAPTATLRPRITGTLLVGRTLTASRGTWSPTATYTYTYTWKRGLTVVGTGPTHVATALDRGKAITVTVTATRAGYLAGTAVSLPVTIG